VWFRRRGVAVWIGQCSRRTIVERERERLFLNYDTPWVSSKGQSGVAQIKPLGCPPRGRVGVAQIKPPGMTSNGQGEVAGRANFALNNNWVLASFSLTDTP